MPLANLVRPVSMAIAIRQWAHGPSKRTWWRQAEAEIVQFAGSIMRFSAAAIGLFGLGIQYCLMTETNTDLIEATCRFLCYFTFWANAICALSMLAPVLAARTPLGQYFSRPDVRSSLAANLLVVGVVYHFFLSDAFEWDWGCLADFLLHYITPAFYIIDWLLFVPRSHLAWRVTSASLILPVIYGILTLAYGATTQWSPYPFLEIQALNVHDIALNLVCLLGLFLITAAIIVFIDRTLPNRPLLAVLRSR